MKNTSRKAIMLAAAILMVACNPSMLLPGPTATLSTGQAAISTAVVSTLLFRQTETAAHAPAAATPTPSPRPLPTGIPTIEAARIPGLLQPSIGIQILDPFNGHGLQRVVGSLNGFDQFEWMDSTHLLLHAVVGQTPWEGMILTETWPAVINLVSRQAWVPHVDHSTSGIPSTGIPLPAWSARLGILISTQASASGGDVLIYDLEGKLVKMYSGPLLGVSPSGAKILIADDTWIDLGTGRTVDFAWYQNNAGMDPFSFPPIWSPDETRVYACCYRYGDAETGRSFVISHDDITIDGKKPDEAMHGGLYNFFGTWVLNDRYLLSQWGGIWDGNPGFIPLFDPAAKTYRNLNAAAGIPNDIRFPGSDSPDPNCQRTSAAPGGRYVWVECHSGDYVVDLTNFKSSAFPEYAYADVEWSADGAFALISGEDREGRSFSQILTLSGHQLKPLSADPRHEGPAWWHPTDATLAYRSGPEKSLAVLAARTMSARVVTLAVPLRTAVWSPKGDHLALVAEDGSIWQVDYPTLENLEQLTAPMPGSTPARPGGTQPRVTNILWSPDGSWLAFVGDTDIYIVDTKTGP